MDSPLDTSLWNRGNADNGAAPLSPEDLADLLPTHISLRGELNEFEAAGLLKAEGWAFSRRRSMASLLTEGFIRGLHRQMLGGIWKWAGTYRQRETNFGVDPASIPVELRKSLDDARYWLDHRTYSPDEIAVRFHYRLVCVHPFPNGNGRLSRLMADLVGIAQGSKRFTWGQTIEEAARRKSYLAALKAADNGGGDCTELVTFARL